MRRVALGATVLLALLAVAGVAGSVLAQGRGAGSGPTVKFVTLEIGGVQEGAFEGVRGMEAVTEVIEDIIVDADGRQHIAKIPGTTRYGNITLKAGLIESPVIGWYFDDMLQGEVIRKDGSVVLRDAEGNAVAQYDFERAWPCRWRGPVLEPSSTRAYVEELDLCVETWTKVDLNAPVEPVE